MATKSFTINTEPHVATVGETKLLFQPEVMGDEFMDAYAELRDVQKSATGLDVDDLNGADPDQLRNITQSLRVFLARLMVAESAALFRRVDVVKDDEVLMSFVDREEADEYAASVEGAKAVHGFRLPDRVLVQLLEWVVVLYGGGQEAKRPPTSSGASAPASRKAGTRGMGPLPAKV